MTLRTKVRLGRFLLLVLLGLGSVGCGGGGTAGQASPEDIQSSNAELEAESAAMENMDAYKD